MSSSVASRLNRVRLVCAYYLLLLWLGAMLLVGNVASLPLLLVPPSVREPFLQRAISATFRLFLAGCAFGGIMRFDLTDLDRINAQRGLVLAANHPSMIDVFLVISRVRQAICLMKASITQNAFLAVGAMLAGYVSNRRIDEMIRQAVAKVSSGSLLLIFPEGTRTVRQPVNDLKPGVGLIAKRAQAPIQTILIETNFPYLAKGWPIWRAPAFPVFYKARLGAVLMPAATANETMRRLQAYFESEVPLSINPALQ